MCFTSLLQATEKKEYLIEKVIANNTLLTIIPHKNFKQEYLLGDFKAQYENIDSLELIPEPILCIPFILSTISIVWQSGKTYYVKQMDKKLMNSLDTIKEVYKIFYPQVLWNGELKADELVEYEVEPADNAPMSIVFSGGVDSTYTSFRHNNSPQLLITILGFSEEMDTQKWELIQNQCTSFAQTYKNRTNIFITSNFRSFLKCRKLHKKYPSMNSWREFCQESLSLAGLVAPYLWQYGSSQLCISSSWDWQFPYPWGSHPFIDDNINFMNVKVSNCDYQVNRQEKLRFISDFCSNEKFEKPPLHVCRAKTDASNCNRCEKCLRTINGLIVEEENLSEYGFSISYAQAYEFTKKQFNSKTKLPRFTSAVCHIWQTIATQAKKKLQDDLITDKELKSYLIWLSSMDFSKHINLNQFTHTINLEEIMHVLSRSNTYII